MFTVLVEPVLLYNAVFIFSSQGVLTHWGLRGHYCRERMENTGLDIDNDAIQADRQP